MTKKQFYERMIEPSIKTFISHRFEDITLQFFLRQIMNGKMTEALNYGSYWYDDPKTKSNGEFRFVCVSGFDFNSKEWHLISGEDMYHF